MSVFNLLSLESQTGEEWALSTAWSCLRPGRESSKNGATLWDRNLSVVHRVVMKCACEGAGIFLNVPLSVDVHLCAFFALSQCGVPSECHVLTGFCWVRL